MNAGRALAFVIPLSLASSLCLAEEAPPPEKKAAAAAAASPQKGLVVFVDPVTGQIRQPDPSEIGALTAPPPGSETAKPAAEPPLQMKFGPGGAVGVVLDGRYENFLVVTKTPDGKLAMDCVTGSGKAAEAVAAGAKAAGETGKKEEIARTAKTGKTRTAKNEEAVRVP
jgi:hypothetical protein